MSAKELLVKQIIGTMDLGLPIQIALEQRDDFVDTFIFDIQEHITGRSRGDDRTPSVIRFEVTLDPWYMLVKVKGGLGVNFHLSVVSGHHQ